MAPNFNLTGYLTGYLTSGLIRNYDASPISMDLRSLNNVKVKDVFFNLWMSHVTSHTLPVTCSVQINAASLKWETEKKKKTLELFLCNFHAFINEIHILLKNFILQCFLVLSYFIVIENNPQRISKYIIASDVACEYST